MIANRNFLRSSGGAVGLAVAAQVLQSSLKANLPPNLARIAHNTYALPPLDPADLNAVRNAYMSAIRTVFIVSAPLIGLCLALCLLIKDRGLQRPEERAEAEQKKRDEEAKAAELASIGPRVEEEDPPAQEPATNTVLTTKQAKA